MLNFEQRLIKKADRVNKKKESKKINYVKKRMKEESKLGNKKLEIYDFFESPIHESEILFFEKNFSHIELQEKEWELGYYYILNWGEKL